MKHALIIPLALCQCACEERPAAQAPKPPPAPTTASTKPPPAPETKPPPAPESKPAAAPAPGPDGVIKRTETNSGLIIEDLRLGDGAEAKAHGNVLMHYRGTLADGAEFDSSYKRNEPTAFSLDGVIKGWQEGVPGMKVGGKRRLIVPPELGYAKAGFKVNNQYVVPPDAMLIFEMELVEVRQ